MPDAPSLPWTLPREEERPGPGGGRAGLGALPIFITLPLVIIVVANYLADPILDRFLPRGAGGWGVARNSFLFFADYPLPWLAVTPLVLLACRRVPFVRGRLVRFGLIHGLICVAFSLARGAAHALVFHAGMTPGRGGMSEILVSSALQYIRYDLVFYAGVVSLYQAVDYRRKLRQRELNEARLAESLAKAQLHSLKMKLQPHFLFNALQSINVLVLEKNVTAATEMLERLGSLLRISMESDESLLVPLARELEVLDYYLGIEQIRFADRLQVRRAVDEGAREAFVPNLILQPLVENSIKHGIANRLEGGAIEIEIRRAGARLLIKVGNDGPSLQDSWRESVDRGVGLRTTIRRLELLFPGEFAFGMENRSQGGVATEVAIPFIERITAQEEAERG